MEISANPASRKSFNKSTNTSSTTLSPSSNAAANKTFNKASQGAWEGKNVTASIFFGEDVFGGPDSAVGMGEFGGIDHFKNRTDYSISR